MANICDNELHVYSENINNISKITGFFNDRFPHCMIDDNADNSMIVYFESKWDFPEDDMEDLVDILPDKDDVDMTCLSVEWGDLYCAFHTYDGGKWYYES